MNHSIHLKIMLGVVAVFAALAAFGVPVLSSFPLLGIVLLCPLMMMGMMWFMMRGTDKGASSDADAADTKRSTHQH